MKLHKNTKIFIATALSLALVVALFFGITYLFKDRHDNQDDRAIRADSLDNEPVKVEPKQDKPASSSTPADDAEIGAPKYIFLFIGDGMSYPQIQISSDYLGAVADPNPEILKGGKPLNFMNFPVAGSAITFDSTSFCPDSASTATSISTGHKTHSGVINMDEERAIEFETIAEKLKAQKDYRIGIISTVNLNHATPAAFYAHQPSRNNYYEISQELADSNFDYFAGGGLKQVNGKEGDLTNSYDLLKEAGYTVCMTQAEAEAVTADTGKVVLIDEHLADSDAMLYEIDRKDGMWGLADYVRKGIEVLDNDTGFFMMVEGGKIDWACHANDAGATVNDTLALADGVEEALTFMAKHPDETLILVTGDHETGGLTIGFAGTNYDTFLHNLESQKISYAKFDEDYVAGYIENQTDFADALKDVDALFGLKAPAEGQDEDDKFVMTEYEMSLLERAYGYTVDQTFDEREMTQEEYVLYGGYEPFSVAITHLLNNKSGVDFTSYAHTGLPVGVFASGIGADAFEGYYDNTEIFVRLATLLDVK